MFIIIVKAPGVPEQRHTPLMPPGSFSIAPFGLALGNLLWAYDGWADLAFISGSEEPGLHGLPRKAIWGTLAVITRLLLANSRIWA